MLAFTCSPETCVGLAEMTCKKIASPRGRVEWTPGMPQHGLVAGVQDVPPTIAADDGCAGLMSSSFRRCCPEPRCKAGAVWCCVTTAWIRGGGLVVRENPDC
ncbi:unnamed protein product [Ectocarpus fasciculatus]